MMPSTESSKFQPWLGLFETVWVTQGVPLFAEAHWDNLCEGAGYLGITPPKERPIKVLGKTTGRLRWVLRSDESLEVMFYDEQPHKTRHDFSLALAPQRLGKHNWDARFKTLSYLTHAQARRSVHADEAILLNEDGHVATGAMSNLFWLYQGKLFTPPLEAGCRNGVIRRWLMANFPVEEALVTLDFLMQVDGIAVTNSCLGIQPAARFQTWTSRNQRLFESYQAAYGCEVERQLGYHL